MSQAPQKQQAECFHLPAKLLSGRKVWTSTAQVISPILKNFYYNQYNNIALEGVFCAQKSVIIL